MISRTSKRLLIVFAVTAIGAAIIYFKAGKKSQSTTGKYSLADFKGLSRADMLKQLPNDVDFSKKSDDQLRQDLVTYKNNNS